MRTTIKIHTAVALLGLTSAAFAGEPESKVVVPPPPEPTCPWTLEAALLYLKADSEDSSGYEDQDYEFGYRLSLGYQPVPEGWGVRARYFNFEGTDGSSSEVGPELWSFDLELFRNFSLGSWNGHYALGVRYLDLEEPYSSGYDVDYEGFGPTVGVELVRELGGPWAISAGGRASYIFGDDDEDEAEDEILILEAGLGIQRALTIFGNCDG